MVVDSMGARKDTFTTVERDSSRSLDSTASRLEQQNSNRVTKISDSDIISPSSSGTGSSRFAPSEDPEVQFESEEGAKYFARQYANQDLAKKLGTYNESTGQYTLPRGVRYQYTKDEDTNTINARAYIQESDQELLNKSTVARSVQQDSNVSTSNTDDSTRVSDSSISRLTEQDSSSGIGSARIIPSEDPETQFNNEEDAKAFARQYANQDLAKKLGTYNESTGQYTLPRGVRYQYTRDKDTNTIIATASVRESDTSSDVSRLESDTSTSQTSDSRETITSQEQKLSRLKAALQLSQVLNGSRSGIIPPGVEYNYYRNEQGQVVAEAKLGDMVVDSMGTRKDTFTTVERDVSRLESDAVSDVSRIESDTSSDVSRIESDAVSDVSRLESDTSSDVSRIESDAVSDVSRIESDAVSDVSRLESDTSSDVSRIESDAVSDVSRLESDTSRIESDTSSDVSRIESDAVSDVSRLESDASTSQTSDSRETITNRERAVSRLEAVSQLSQVLNGSKSGIIPPGVEYNYYRNEQGQVVAEAKLGDMVVDSMGARKDTFTSVERDVSSTSLSTDSNETNNVERVVPQTEVQTTDSSNSSSSSIERVSATDTAKIYGSSPEDVEDAKEVARMKSDMKLMDRLGTDSLPAGIRHEYQINETTGEIISTSIFSPVSTNQANYFRKMMEGVSTVPNIERTIQPSQNTFTIDSTTSDSSRFIERSESQPTSSTEQISATSSVKILDNSYESQESAKEEARIKSSYALMEKMGTDSLPAGIQYNYQMDQQTGSITATATYSPEITNQANRFREMMLNNSPSFGDTISSSDNSRTVSFSTNRSSNRPTTIESGTLNRNVTMETTQTQMAAASTPPIIRQGDNVTNQTSVVVNSVPTRKQKDLITGTFEPGFAIG